MEITYTKQELIEMFLQWLDDNDDEAPALPFAVMQSALAEMTDELPGEYCAQLGLKVASSVGHAARASIAVWHGGLEYRLTATIPFESEAESWEWWCRNRDNPDRVKVTEVGHGTYQMEIAPIR